MTIQVNLDGRKRKELATAVSEVLGAEVIYRGPPSYAYEVGRAVINRDGTITLNSKGRFAASAQRRLLEGLSQSGFEPQVIEGEIPTNGESSSKTAVPEEETASPDKLIIQMPLEDFNPDSLDNLTRLVDSKAQLIKKALGVCDLTVRTNGEVLEFPWFDGIPEAGEINAYTNLIAAMCDMAKRQKRVIAVEKPTDNEKFTFRLFLVRLGLIGDKYTDTRRILLRNLSGNGSWKDGESRKASPPRQAEQRTETDVDADADAKVKSIEDRLPSFMGTGSAEDAQCKVSFIKRLGYFLLHFDE